MIFKAGLLASVIFGFAACSAPIRPVESDGIAPSMTDAEIAARGQVDPSFSGASKEARFLGSIFQRVPGDTVGGSVGYLPPADPSIQPSMTDAEIAARSQVDGEFTQSTRPRLFGFRWRRTNG